MVINNDERREYFQPIEMSFEPNKDYNNNIKKVKMEDMKQGQIAVATSLVTLLLPLQEASAKGGAYGIFEGRTASLLHPITMALLFLTSLYSGYLGLQWRKLR